MELTKEEIVEELRKQDEQLDEIFKRRKELRVYCRENNYYNEVHDLLHEDKREHYSF